MEASYTMETGRRRSSIFPQYLRRKSQRKDSTFASESTTNLWPLAIDEKQPSLFDYQNEKSEDKSFKFGWINGVYIRTVLNIWGVMLFLRMGWITGQAGIVVGLAIVVLSTLVTMCTTLSMSAICTNGEVGTGGIYYMISRSLGAEAGSMIGIIFSFANAVLVSLNLVGAAETTVEILKIFDITLIDTINDTRIYGIILLVVVAIIPLIGMDWEAKAMFVLLVILLLSILNYVIGTFIPPTETQISQGNIGWKTHVLSSNLWPKFDNESFSNVFAVFFPSVIGIFAGASMSGDLRDPNAAIPKGTFLAILTTSSVYIFLILMLGCTIVPFANGIFEDMNNLIDPLTLPCIENGTCIHGLIKDYQTMTLSSAYGPIIYAGIYAATISSALGSYVCSPRIFQALCEDKLFPYIHFFAKGYGKNNDPKRGYILTFIISLLFILIGELNAISPIISNFFMASFCLVNIACFYASFVGSPSFRPTFKYYNKWVSLVSGLVCIGIMFFLDWISALITLFIMGIIFLYIAKKQPDVNWGSYTRGHVYNNALSSALKLNYGKDHVKNFRPSFLLLTGNPSARIPLVEFTNHITKNQSLLLIGHIINYEIPYPIREKVIDSQYKWMLRRKIKGFYLLLESSSLAGGAKTLFQVAGLGRKLAPNILMLGYKSSWRDCIVEDLLDYYNIILNAMQQSMGICILRIQEGLDYADFFGPMGKSAGTARSNSNLAHTEDFTEANGNSLTVIEEPTEDEDSDKNSNINTVVHFDKTVNFQQEQNTQFYQQYLINSKLERMKKLVPNDAINAINQFSEKQKDGPIDIWWLTEDGGLAILIPYLLNVNYIWSGCHIRLFCFSKTTEEMEQMKSNMEELMDRLRIPFNEVIVFAESDLEATEQSKDRFRNFIKNFMAKNDVSVPSKAKVTKAELAKFEDKTSKYLKIRDMLVEKSKMSTLIVMTLPMPHKEIPASLFMSWLETITGDMPPFLFVRGNRNVISI